MITAITIPCAERFDCLRTMLETLASNQEVASGKVSVILCPDAQPKESLGRMREISDAFAQNGFVSAAPESRLYGCQNILRSIRIAFASGVDRVIRMDSDLKASPFYIRQVLALAEQTNLPSQSGIICKMDYEQKRQHASEAVYGCHTGTNLVLAFAQWAAISPLVDEYEGKFLTTGPHKRNHAQARQWFSDHASAIPDGSPWKSAYVSQTVGTGADSAIFFALLCGGMDVASMVVNRLIHASNEGENYSSGEYAEMQASTLDVLAEDITPRSFVTR